MWRSTCLGTTHLEESRGEGPGTKGVCLEGKTQAFRLPEKSQWSVIWGFFWGRRERKECRVVGMEFRVTDHEGRGPTRGTGLQCVCCARKPAAPWTRRSRTRTVLMERRLQPPHSSLRPSRTSDRLPESQAPATARNSPKYAPNRTETHARSLSQHTQCGLVYPRDPRRMSSSPSRLGGSGGSALSGRTPGRSTASPNSRLARTAASLYLSST